VSLPRPRFTVRRLMVAVASTAVLILAAKAVLSRPHPTSMWDTSAGYYITWSDGTMTQIDPTPRPLVLREWRWGTLVNWPDGSFSVYLHLR
jgi:hypothetical protein